MLFQRLHQMTSRNILLFNVVGALDHVALMKMEMRSLFGQLRCALFLSRK